MNVQTAIAVAVVILCGAVIMRSWIQFWLRLIRSPYAKPESTSCSSCAHGCSRSKDLSPLVELKRISLEKTKETQTR